MKRRAFISTSFKAALGLCLLKYTTGLAAPSDDSPYSLQLKLVEIIRQYAASLGLKFGDDFYTQWQPQLNSLQHYLYVSLPDKIAAPEGIDNYIFCGADTDAALRKLSEYNAQGYHTLLYKTAGTSAARLNTVLLSYPGETISFILFHEATHRHIRAKEPHLPYIFDEASCDVIGNYATLALVDKDNDKNSRHIAAEYRKRMEAIYKVINKSMEKLENSDRHSRDALYHHCQKRILHLLPANPFFVTRYDYEVNNAYFLRYRSYARHYFLLRKVMHKVGVPAFVHLLSELPPDEGETSQILERVCHSG